LASVGERNGGLLRFDKDQSPLPEQIVKPNGVARLGIFQISHVGFGQDCRLRTGRTESRAATAATIGNSGRKCAMSRASKWLYGVAYCTLSVVISVVVCAIAGALIGQTLIPEEARGLIEGGTLGAYAGVVLGLLLGLAAVLWPRRVNPKAQSQKT
jgi:hypothetical protein